MKSIELTGRDVGVLLLHGLSGNPLEVQALARHLNKEGYGVLCPTVPGFAFGTRPDPYDTGTWEEWLAFAEGELSRMRRQYRQVVVGGICIGALLSLKLAERHPEDVDGLILISTTLAYDGWAMPWYRFLAPIGYYTPLRRMISWPERHPYGLKNERLREWIARTMAAHGDSPAGAASLPLAGIHEAERLIRSVRGGIGKVTAPALVMHAVDDDVASPKSAEFVARHIGSDHVRTILFANSYHMLTLDNDKEDVARESLAFLRAQCPETSAIPQDRHTKIAGRE